MNITYNKFFPKSHIWDIEEGVTYLCSITNGEMEYDCGITNLSKERYSAIVVESERTGDYHSITIYEGNCLTSFIIRMFKKYNHNILTNAFKLCYSEALKNGLLDHTSCKITDETAHLISSIDMDVSHFLSNYVGRKMTVFFYGSPPIEKTVEVTYRRGKAFHLLYEDDNIDYKNMMHVEIHEATT